MIFMQKRNDDAYELIWMREIGKFVLLSNLNRTDFNLMIEHFKQMKFSFKTRPYLSKRE